MFELRPIVVDKIFRRVIELAKIETRKNESISAFLTRPTQKIFFAERTNQSVQKSEKQNFEEKCIQQCEELNSYDPSHEDFPKKRRTASFPPDCLSFYKDSCCSPSSWRVTTFPPKILSTVRLVLSDRIKTKRKPPFDLLNKQNKGRHCFQEIVATSVVGQRQLQLLLLFTN